MNKFKQLMTLIVLFLSTLLLTNCETKNDITPEEDSVRETPQLSEVESNDFFKQNISIFDARVRSLDENKYVKELYLANFSDKVWDKTEVGFDGMLFKDNGKGNDLVANDQIFTSVLKFDFNSVVSYNKNTPVKSVMKNSIISPDFKHIKDIKSLSAKYTSNNKVANTFAKSRDVGISVTCDVEICSSGCIADWIWEGFGCICVSNCKVTLSALPLSVGDKDKV